MKMSNKKLLTELQNILGGELPPVFSKKTPKPLKCGIFEDMIAPYPEAKAADLSAWFAKWTSSRSYLERVARGRTQRHDLDGNPVSPILDSERNYAKRQLSALAIAEMRKRHICDRPRPV
jgi:sRNA-binding protein